MALKDKSRTDLAEKIAKHSDLSVNAVLRVFYSLLEHGIDVLSIEAISLEPAPSAPKKRKSRIQAPTVPTSEDVV